MNIKYVIESCDGFKWEEKQYISISWPKAKEIVMTMGYYSKMSDPIALFNWSLIGLKLVRNIITDNCVTLRDISTYGWKFEIVDKKKLSFMMLKHSFSL